MSVVGGRKERETDRQTDRQADRQTDRQSETERHRETQTQRDRDSETDRDRETETHTETETQVETEAERQRQIQRQRNTDRDRETERQTEWQTEGQTGRQKDRQTEKDRETDIERGKEKNGGPAGRPTLPWQTERSTDPCLQYVTGLIQTKLQMCHRVLWRQRGTRENKCKLFKDFGKNKSLDRFILLLELRPSDSADGVKLLITTGPQSTYIICCFSSRVCWLKVQNVPLPSSSSHENNQSEDSHICVEHTCGIVR